MYYVKNTKKTKNIYDYVGYETKNRPYGLRFYKNKELQYFENAYELKCKNKLKILNITTKKTLDNFINSYGNKNTINWEKLYKKYDGLFINNYDKILIELLKSRYLIELFNKDVIVNKYEWFINNNSNSGFIWNLKNINIK